MTGIHVYAQSHNPQAARKSVRTSGYVLLEFE